MNDLKHVVKTRVAAGLVKAAMLKKLAGDAPPAAPAWDTNKWLDTQKDQLDAFGKHIESPMAGSFGFDQSYIDKIVDKAGNALPNAVGTGLDKADTFLGDFIPDWAKSGATAAVDFATKGDAKSTARTAINMFTAKPFNFNLKDVPEEHRDAVRRAMLDRTLTARIEGLKAEPTVATGQNINALRDGNYNVLHRLALSMRMSNDPEIRARAEAILQDVSKYRVGAGYKAKDAKDFTPDDQKRWDAVQAELGGLSSLPDALEAPLLDSVQQEGIQKKVDDFNIAVDQADAVTNDPNYKGPKFGDWISNNWQSLLAPIGLIIALTGGKTGAIIGLGMAAWGGYDIYQKFNKVKNPEAAKAFMTWSKSGFSKESYKDIVVQHGEAAAEGAGLLLPLAKIGWAKDFIKSTAVDKANELSLGLTGAGGIKANPSPAPAPLKAPTTAPTPAAPTPAPTPAKPAAPAAPAATAATAPAQVAPRPNVPRTAPQMP
jgi:hypothetical protein